MSQVIRWLFPVFLTMVVFAILFLSSPDTRPLPQPSLIFKTSAPEPDSSDFLVHTPGCRIPYMNAFDPGIRKYIKRVKDISCTRGEPLILSNETSLWVNPRAFQFLDSTFDSSFHCCYVSFWRKAHTGRSYDVLPDSSIVYENECHSFSESIDVHDEFIKVTCFLRGSRIYEDYHAFVKPKIFKNNSTTVPQIKGRKPSVLIIGMDAVSRLNFYRQMPRTVEFLRFHGAVELLGYNKVDDNTFPNLVPVLAGKSVKELRRTCWRGDKDFFDDCPFIWNNFRSAGYQTGFGEDACWMGIFQYVKSGFFQPPVDNYLHTFMYNAEKDIGHMKKMNAKLCIGPRPAAQVLFDYVEKFAVNLTKSDLPYFGFFWGTSLTHDYLNVQPQTDAVYQRLLRNLIENGVMNNTIVIVMSDHGIRWGAIRETYQGRVEERLPLVWFLMPTWFKEEHPAEYSNLRRNRLMLTVPYDLHETLKDILNLSSISAKVPTSDKLPRGISLFRPVPAIRTCEDAEIPENYCTCHESRNISVDEKNVRKAADEVVAFLNQKLFPYMQCAQLTLKKVVSAQLESPRKEVVSSTGSSVIEDVTVVIITNPGQGEFEATVRYIQAQNNFSVLGSVSRINAYGDQSKCVDNYQMRLYCYCS